MLKERVFVLNVSKWEMDGKHGCKITWTNLDRVTSENRSGVEILSASCPFEVYASVPPAPFFADLDLSLTSANVNGRTSSKVAVLGVHAVDEKKLVTNCASVSLNP